MKTPTSYPDTIYKVSNLIRYVIDIPSHEYPYRKFIKPEFIKDLIFL